MKIYIVLYGRIKELYNKVDSIRFYYCCGKHLFIDYFPKCIKTILSFFCTSEIITYKYKYISSGTSRIKEKKL